MSRPLTRILSLLLSLTLILGTVTLCWLSLPNAVNFPTSFGSANPTYFESGNGSAEHPYIISRPVHLYNLAWLQYLGYFNLNPNLNNGRAQSYFKLKNNIVMTGIAIPPIGTEEYPFIGKFDGNHKTISSLTVSNSHFDLTRYPTAAVFDQKTSVGKLQTAGSTEGNGKEVAIVGLFGVTGDYGSAIKQNEAYRGKDIHQYVDPDAEEKKLVSPPINPNEITENDLYYASMFVGNFYTDILHVRSASTNTLVGLAAGYVGGGFENIGVYRADITLTKNATSLKEENSEVVSKYAIVGDYDPDAVGWSEAPKEGTTQGGGWGGTIDMELFAERLKNMLAATQKDSGNNRVVTTYNNQSAFGYYKSEGFNLYAAIYAGTNQNLTDAKYSLDTSKAMSVALLADGSNYTVLPLNVNKEQMGLKAAVPEIYSSTNSEQRKTAEATQNAQLYKYQSSSARFTKTATVLTPNNLSSPFEWKILYGYLDAETSGEIVDSEKGNTGYIVGGNTQDNRGGIVLDVRPRTSAQSIFKSFHKSSAAEWTTYNSSDLRLLTYNRDKKSGETDYAVIGDKKNNLSVGTTTDVGGNSFTVIGSNGFEKYDDRRDDFDDVLGKDGSLYGLLFSSKGLGLLPNASAPNAGYYAKTITKSVALNHQTIGEYPLVTGSINFTVKEAGVIVAIVGTYNTQSKDNMQGHFNLYKADRTDSGSGVTVPSVTKDGKTVKVKEIVLIYETKNEAGVSVRKNIYWEATEPGKGVLKDDDNNTFGADANNVSLPSGAKLIYNKLWYTRNDHSAADTGTTPLLNNYAYYIEIPVEAGDYLISTNGGGTNGYLMYLDIGASGAGGNPGVSKPTPYLMQSVDFINESSRDTAGRVTVPSATDPTTGNLVHFYPKYAAVGLRLSGVSSLTGDAVVVMKRDTDTITNGVGEINTVLYYNVLPESIAVTPLPSALAEKNTTLGKEEDESG